MGLKKEGFIESDCAWIVVARIANATSRKSFAFIA
jgi:hypothetical protein